jgi:hypothetical protein
MTGSLKKRDFNPLLCKGGLRRIFVGCLDSLLLRKVEGLFLCTCAELVSISRQRRYKRKLKQVQLILFRILSSKYLTFTITTIRRNLLLSKSSLIIARCQNSDL